MRLQKLTGLERDKVKEEHAELMALITRLKEILENKELRMEIIKEELIDVQSKYGDDRRTEIEYASADFRMEDMIADEKVVITISHLGYMKRTSLAEYKLQNRGGVGSKGTNTRDEDFLEHMFVATNHNYLLIFTQKGKCFWMRVFEIPEGSKSSKGRAIQNLLNIEQDDKVMAYINVKDLKDEEYINNNYLIMCTSKGIIKKTSLEAYSRPRTNGINAISIREGDQLLEAKLTSGNDEILLGLKSGRAIRFNESKVRPMGRNAAGVKGITLGNDKDMVVGMVCVNDNESDILVVSEKGYGKRSSLEDYRITNRGGKGVKTLSITDKTGKLIAIKNVTDENELMIINKAGVVIRLDVSDLRTMGRATQGVRLINLKGNDEIAAVAKVEKDSDSDIDDELEGLPTNDTDTDAPEAKNDENQDLSDE